MKLWIKIAVAIVCLALLFFLSIEPINDLTARLVARRLERIPLPESTSVVASGSGAGRYDGNGNGMQYCAWVYLESELSVDELREYYTSRLDDCTVEQNGSQIVVKAWGDGIPIFAELDLRGH